MTYTQSHTLENYYFCAILNFRTQLMHCEKVSCTHTAACLDSQQHIIWDLKLIKTDLFIVCIVCFHYRHKYDVFTSVECPSNFLWLTVWTKKSMFIDKYVTSGLLSSFAYCYKHTWFHSKESMRHLGKNKWLAFSRSFIVCLYFYIRFIKMIFFLSDFSFFILFPKDSKAESIC